jgi:hypothetical protein
MSKTLLIIGCLLAAAMLAVGCWALTQGEDNLFFQCAVGSIFVFGFLYMGNFFQSLNPPTASKERFRTRGLKEEIQALAEANPQHPGLRRMFGWFIVGVLFIVFIRVIQLVST